MQQVRLNVFETNSSSSHSLTLAPSEIKAPLFSDAILRRGWVELYLGDYQWEWHRYYKLENKLRYLMTQLVKEVEALGSAHEVTKNLREEDNRIDTLCRVVEEHTGVRVLLSPGSTGSIDHESVGVGTELFHSDEKLAEFLFSEQAYIETGNDNSGPGQNIDTDRGKEDFYEYLYWQPPTTHVPLKLWAWKTWGNDMGLEVGTALPEDLVDKVLNQGTVSQVDWTSEGDNSYFRHREAKGGVLGYLSSRNGSKGLRCLKDFKFNFKHERARVAPGERLPYSQEKIGITILVPQALADEVTAYVAPKKRKPGRPKKQVSPSV